MHESEDKNVAINKSTYQLSIGPKFPKFKKEEWDYWTPSE
jgi:hypothetical protein